MLGKRKRRELKGGPCDEGLIFHNFYDRKMKKKWVMYLLGVCVGGHFRIRFFLF